MTISGNLRMNGGTVTYNAGEYRRAQRSADVGGTDYIAPQLQF